MGLLVEGTAGPSTTLRSGPTARRGRRDDKEIGEYSQVPEMKLRTSPLSVKIAP
jgi:hypothetical protein